MPIWCQLAAALLMLVGGVVSRPPVVALAASSYAPTVLGDSPGTYWRLGEATGTTAADASSNGNTGTYQPGATLAQAGAVVGDTDTAALLNGTSGYVSSTLSGRTADTLEVWLKTTTTTGGLLVGVDATQTGAGTLTEALYMNNAGNVLYGLSAAVTVQSSGTFKDGFWHHAVGVANGTTISLYMDGILVQSRATALLPAVGYVRAGFDNLAGWTGAPTRNFFTGTIDEVAAYPNALTTTQVANHMAASATLPGAPVIGAVTGGVNQVTVNWTVASPIGGSAILAYRVFALQAGQQVAAVTATSAARSVVVKGLVGIYTFRVAAANSEGMGPQTALSSSATATGANGYFQVIRGDSPTAYWRLSDPYGLSSTDSSATGANTGALTNGITRVQAGALASGSGSSPDADLAVLLDGTTASVSTTTTYANPVDYSIETWFKSSSSKGGVLVGFDNGAGTTDRILYLNNAGNLVFGVKPGAISAITSPLTYRTNVWHHVVATQSSTAGLALYVDGYLVAANSTLTTAGNYTGAWRMGFETLSGWPQVPTSNFLSATMDETAVYGAALTPARVLAHFQAAQVTPVGPVLGTVTPGTNSAALTWTAVPAAGRGDSVITAYRVSAFSGGVLQDTVTSTIASVTMRGLLGSGYTFKVTAVNSEGAGALASYPGTFTVSGAATYSSTVTPDAPSLWYRFSDPASALTLADQSGGSNTGTYQFGVTRMVAGALSLSTGGSADADVAVTLDGSTGSVLSSAALANPAPFSEEIWFKTLSATGGALLGFDNGGAADRVLYMTNAGNLVFGVNPGTMTTITTPKTYKDGFWHHAVASLGALGMTLSVDGYQVAGNASVTTAANITGSWRVGTETLTGWPGAPTSSYLSASLDDAAIYSTQLSAARVAAHFVSAAITPGAPTLGTVTPGTNNAVVTWTAPALVGDSAITGYRVTASSGAQPQDTVTALSTATSATVYGLLGAYTFTVLAVNSEGSGSASGTAAGTVSGPATFFSTLRADSPSVVYRLDDPATLAVTDASATGTDTGALINGVTAAAAGALGSTTDADTGLTLDGLSGYVSSTHQFTSTPVPFSVEVKFKTTTSTGGVLVDMGSSATGPSTTVDRVLYMTNAGNLVLGLNAGTMQTVSSPLSYRDGQWHTASAVVSATTMTLYIDGTQVATGPSTSTASSGYWRVGFDSLAGWPSAPTSNFLAGSVDEFAAFTTALSAAQIQAHIVAGGQVPSAPGVPALSSAQQSQMTATWTVPASAGASPLLTYTLFASASGLPVQSITVASASLSATVGGLASATSYTFTVVATNSQGTGPGASAAGTTAGTASAYLPALLADGVTQYYRLDEATGTTAWDFSGAGDNGTDTGGFTLNAAGATASDGDHSTTANGSTGFASTAQSLTAPASVSVEGWFKSSSVTGGAIVGFGSTQTGTATTADRVLYLSNSGSVVFGINTGSRVTVASASGYNDGQWHMAVGTLAAGGAMTLYVDGGQVATNAGPLTALSYAGFWRIGNQTLTGYASAPTSFFLNGSIDDVAVMPTALSAAQVQAEFDLSGAVPGAPTGLSASVSAQDVLVSFTAPSVGDSPISGYTIVALQSGVPAQTITVSSSPGLIGGLSGGVAYTMTVAANNAEGQGPAASTSVTADAASAYFNEIQGDGPDMGWYRFDESQGTTAFDFSSGGGTNTAVFRGGVTLSQDGGIASDGADKAVLLNGSSGYVSTTTAYSSPDPLTAEAWFKTTTTSGGELLGLGSALTGSSAAVDRALYMTNSGNLSFGVHPGVFSTVTSPRSYNDGQWHVAAGTWSSTAGLALFVDGQSVASDPTATSAATITGYVRAGFDNLASWPSAPTSNFFGGTVDEVAVFPVVLTAGQIDSHFGVSGAAPGSPAITTITPAAMTAAVSWTAPASIGISPLLSSTVSASVGGVLKQSMVVAPATTSTTLGGLIPGTTYSVVVTATNSEASAASNAVVAATTGSQSTYGQAVQADTPTLWYRLDEASGTTAWDSSGAVNTGTYQGTVTLNVPGALSGASSDGAVQLNGTSGYVSSSVSQSNPTLFSTEAWVKTTTTSGGMIVGFGSGQTGLSGQTDRVLYMTNAGTVVFGANPSGTAQTISSSAALNDGVWHHLVATLSPSGMALYVDGRSAASSSATGAKSMSGFWRAGFDNLAGWPSAPLSNLLAGSLDEVAVYPAALTLSQVQAHYRGYVGAPITISLTGVPSSFSISGNPSSTVTQGSAETYRVTTNDPLGYTVTVQAQRATLLGATGGNTDTIPLGNVSARAHGGGGFTPVSSASAVVVHSATSASAPGGDLLADDYQVAVPFVNSDTYSVALVYLVSTN